MAAAVAMALVGMHAASESSENSNIWMEPRLEGRHGNCRRRCSSVRYLMVSFVVMVSLLVTTGRMGTSCIHAPLVGAGFFKPLRLGLSELRDAIHLGLE